jgi:hypothetical protein
MPALIKVALLLTLVPVGAFLFREQLAKNEDLGDGRVMLRRALKTASAVRSVGVERNAP